MGPWTFAPLAVLAAAWIWLRLRAERDRLPRIVEQLSDRAVILLSRAGEPTSIGPAALRALGLVGRVDRLRRDDLPLEGLEHRLFAAECPPLGDAAALAPVYVYDGAGSRTQVEADLVPVRPARGPLPALFSFEIPEEMTMDDPTPTGALAGKHVLVADDSADNRKLATYFLEGEGARVTTADDGREAVELSAREAFDLVFLDLQMPVMDGLEAARRIREARPQLTLVALTGGTAAADEARCKAAGFTSFLTKPLRRKAIRDLAGTLNEEPLTDESLFSDPEFQALIAEFTEELGSRVDAIEAATAAGDWDLVEALAHKLKGAAAGFGLDEIAAKAATLEASPPESVALIDDLRALVSAT